MLKKIKFILFGVIALVIAQLLSRFIVNYYISYIFHHVPLKQYINTMKQPELSFRILLLSVSFLLYLGYFFVGLLIAYNNKPNSLLYAALTGFISCVIEVLLSPVLLLSFVVNGNIKQILINIFPYWHLIAAVIGGFVGSKVYIWNKSNLINIAKIKSTKKKGNITNKKF